MDDSSLPRAAWRVGEAPFLSTDKIARDLLRGATAKLTGRPISGCVPRDSSDDPPSGADGPGIMMYGDCRRAPTYKPPVSLARTPRSLAGVFTAGQGCGARAARASAHRLAV